MRRQEKPFRDRTIEQSLLHAAEIGVGVLAKHHRRLKSIEKKGAIDLVTKADRESERRVFEYLRKRHPDHALIGEEGWNGDRPEGGYAWVLDPLDGTTNYAHGLDHYSLSLGVLRDGEPVAGIVMDPLRGHIYHAFKGRGALRNRDRLRVSSTAVLGESLIATGFPYDRRQRLKDLMKVLAAFLERTHGIRRFGSAAMDLALVAAGQFDGYYEPRLHVWDVVAGILLVTEAGGKVTDYDGQPVDLFNPSVVAANPKIHKEMLKVLRTVLGSKFVRASK